LGIQIISKDLIWVLGFDLEHEALGGGLLGFAKSWRRIPTMEGIMNTTMATDRFDLDLYLADEVAE